MRIVWWWHCNPLLICLSWDVHLIFFIFSSISKDLHLQASPVRKATPPPRRLCVRNLSRNVTKEHLSEIFSVYGALRSCELPMDRQHTHLGRGFCFLSYLYHILIQFWHNFSLKIFKLKVISGAVESCTWSVTYYPCWRDEFFCRDFLSILILY